MTLPARLHRSNWSAAPVALGEDLVDTLVRHSGDDSDVAECKAALFEFACDLAAVRGQSFLELGGLFLKRGYLRGGVIEFRVDV